jgi:hypothetical protein
LRDRPDRRVARAAVQRDRQERGFPVVIFGGANADLPLGAAHGEALAEIIGTSSTPAIIDTSLMRVGERTRFFADFADAMVRKNKGPLHLVIDEAHLFAPQGKVNDPQSGAMLHAANNLVSLGRSRGLRIILITQRPAKLHKDSLTQVETLVALRLIAPQDRKAVEEWIKDNADEKKGREIIDVAGDPADRPRLGLGAGDRPAGARDVPEDQDVRHQPRAGCWRGWRRSRCWRPSTAAQSRSGYRPSRPTRWRTIPRPSRPKWRSCGGNWRRSPAGR